MKTIVSVFATVQAERDVPPDVALDEVDVALDHSAETDELMAQREVHRAHQSSPLSPFSKAWPLAAKNASSRVVEL